MYIYLDDIRTPRADHPWEICRNYFEFKLAFITWIEMILEPNHQLEELYISFDHDIDSYDKDGNELTGYSALKWMINHLIEIKRPLLANLISVNVHSANPVGKKNIEAYWESFLKSL